MILSDKQFIGAPKIIVWTALNDPEILRQCIPGCKEIERVSPSVMTAKAVIKIGPIAAAFAGKVSFSDVDPPNGYTITGEGQGGVAGFAKGSAVVRLEAEGNSTILHYDVKADVGGKIAQLGARLIDATARKLAGEFFTKFGAVVAVMPADMPSTRPAEIDEPARGKWFQRLWSWLFGSKRHTS